MKTFKHLQYTFLFFGFLLVFGCGPKSISTERENLAKSSQEWIPFNGDESVVFEHDTNKMIFTGLNKTSYYENVRYMSDQSGFFQVQEDYYAELERVEMTFESDATSYIIKYYLERNKGDVGDWDVLRVCLSDGDFYKNEIKIIVYENNDFDKGEYFQYKTKVILNKVQFNDVYFRKQEQRPLEIYYTKESGIVAFKLSSQEVWTLKQDTIF